MSLYQCEECGYVCPEEEMEGDATSATGDGSEMWSNWICPSCGMWHSGLGEDDGWKPVPDDTPRVPKMTDAERRAFLFKD